MCVHGNRKGSNPSLTHVRLVCLTHKRVTMVVFQGRDFRDPVAYLLIERFGFLDFGSVGGMFLSRRTWSDGNGGGTDAVINGDNIVWQLMKD